MSEFVKAATVDEIREGEMLPVEVQEEPICLTRVEGTIYAFTNNCTHISGPLNEGELCGYVLECPWHLAHFDVRNGKVLRGPARQDLYTYPVKIEGNDVLIGMPDEEW